MHYEHFARHEKTLRSVLTAVLVLTIGLLSACGGAYNKYDNLAGVPGADPYVISQNDAYYYCYSADGGIAVAKLDGLNAITKDRGKLVYDAGKDDLYSVWAPELHYLEGEWYIYAAMCLGTDNSNYHRMYVLKGTSQDPTEPFTLVGQITDETDKWAIDGTVFCYGEDLYTIWSGWEKDVNLRQDLYIAHMSDPCTIDSPRVCISSPDSWDMITTGPSVNEGPCVVKNGEKIYCLYSGNGSWTDDYCIGYLTFNGTDPMDASAWTKCSEPILSQEKDFYGPGHCSVVTGKDNAQYVIYHANLKAFMGWKGRSVRIQKLFFTENGPEKIEQKESVKIPY